MATSTRAEQRGLALEHLEGCPKDPTRIEVFERPRAGKDGEPGSVVTVTHCVDCGNEAIHSGSGSKRKKEAADGGDEG